MPSALFITALQNHKRAGLVPWTVSLCMALRKPPLKEGTAVPPRLAGMWARGHPQRHSVSGEYVRQGPLQGFRVSRLWTRPTSILNQHPHCWANPLQVIQRHVVFIPRTLIIIFLN